jgi:hypothetical protein
MLLLIQEVSGERDGLVCNISSVGEGVRELVTVATGVDNGAVVAGGIILRTFEVDNCVDLVVVVDYVGEISMA